MRSVRQRSPDTTAWVINYGCMWKAMFELKSQASTELTAHNGLKTLTSSLCVFKLLL
jgi:hypothetical protein